MAEIDVGYARLVATWALEALPLQQIARIDSGTQHRASRAVGDAEILAFNTTYTPAATFEGDLRFALRYEGVNLQVLELLFAKVGTEPLVRWLHAQPESTYARRIGFLYEWLTQAMLDVAPLDRRVSFVFALDEALQFGLGKTDDVDQKFRVRNNLPGTRDFCPLVRKTAALRDYSAKDLRSQAAQTLSKYDQTLLRRASQYLYLKETRSSYEVERERPSLNRTQRFVELLKTAPSGKPLSQQRFVEAQNAIIDPRWHEFAYRSTQNWVGGQHRYREMVDFVPPRPDDVPALMSGLCALSARGREAAKTNASLDQVVHAATVAFGFVFVHPFIDGNGRLHRYLIHEELSTLQFTPAGIVLPVSAFILANQELYVQVLEQFSRPRLARTEFAPEHPEKPAIGNDGTYFRFFDATAQALFLYRALERTISHDLEEEINYLLGVDRARYRLKDELDWPAQSLDLFINIVRQGGGALSKTKRASHFSWLTDDELARFIPAVNEAFDLAHPGADS
jgi:Fic family protein